MRAARAAAEWDEARRRHPERALLPGTEYRAVSTPDGLWRVAHADGEFGGSFLPGGLDVEPLDAERTAVYSQAVSDADVEEMARVFGERYGQLAVYADGFSLAHCAVLHGSPEPAVVAESAVQPGDIVRLLAREPAVTEEPQSQPKTLAEARRMVRLLRKERDEARVMTREYQNRAEDAQRRAVQGEKYLAVLAEVISLFVEDGGHGFVRSVNVSLDDYHAWSMLVRRAQKTSDDDAA
jgi:hypothetical protein